MSEDFLKNPLSLFDIRGKTAIVTGASGAFGALAAEGAGGRRLQSGAGGRRRSRRSSRWRPNARSSAPRSKPSTSGRARRPIATRWWQAAVKRFGGVDILVLAAGINKVSKIVDQPPEAFIEVMDVNVTQSWLMARAAGKQMLAQGRGGKVVFMSSARGLLGHPAGYTAYCASKSAIDGVTKALGCEWGDTGITVNAIAPTVFRSPAHRLDVRGHRARHHGAQGFCRARAEGTAGRALRPGRAAPVPGLGGVGFLYRPYPLCRRRLHGGLSMADQGAHRGRWAPA